MILPVYLDTAAIRLARNSTHTFASVALAWRNLAASPHLPPAGCQSAKPFLLQAPFPLSHRPHWLTVELGFSVTDRLFLKAPSFIRRDRKNGETMDRKLGFQPSSPCTTCLVSDLNTGMDLDLSELVSLFSFLFFFVCDRSMCVQVGCTCVHVEARAQCWASLYQSQTYFLR